MEQCISVENHYLVSSAFPMGVAPLIGGYMVVTAGFIYWRRTGTKQRGCIMGTFTAQILIGQGHPYPAYIRLIICSFPKTTVRHGFSYPKTFSEGFNGWGDEELCVIWRGGILRMSGETG